MPEILQKKINGISTGEMDWNKFFMGLAMGIVFILQAWSQIQHEYTKDTISELDKKIVPRHEIENTYVPGQKISEKDIELEKQIMTLKKEIEIISGSK